MADKRSFYGVKELIMGAGQIDVKDPSKGTKLYTLSGIIEVREPYQEVKRALWPDEK